MGSALSEDVMKVISDTNKREAQVNELLHSVSAEEEDSGDDIVLLEGVDELGSCVVEFGGGVHQTELVFFEKAHGHAEVVLT